MKNNTGVKIIASLALLWIVISIIGTWILLIFESSRTPTEAQKTLTPEQLAELQKLIESQSWSLNIDSDTISLPEVTQTGSLENK